MLIAQARVCTRAHALARTLTGIARSHLDCTRQVRPLACVVVLVLPLGQARPGRAIHPLVEVRILFFSLVLALVPERILGLV